MTGGSTSAPSETRPRWKRVVLKLSGEALAEPTGFGLDTNTLQQVATEIKEVREPLGIDIAIVAGGGDFRLLRLDRVRLSIEGALQYLALGFVHGDFVQ